MENREAARALFGVASLLESQNANPYRVRAYRRAARLLLTAGRDAKVKLVEGKEGKELDLPGLGLRLRRKLGELLATGRMRFYVELCADLPDDVSRLMQIPNVGPKTALRLHEELGLSTPVDVYAAAQAGKIRSLYGFGEKRERQLLRGAQEVLAGRIKSFAPVPAEESDEPAIARPTPTPMAPVPAQMNLPVAA